ncbi:uncharacterized protein KY384_004407 [Bacidia gigantensis]|uniref:uncharacterized protein n=1 Tax=Bacidia gigantensis TaxID=2732470 RepID=UPI001D05048C|nr:uncharacterized protein KY384_004407 [Bacidia gigantensis]KAG8531050.1 hypothetical protein KY384_004407 [Bacidia gigantensis]
MSSIGHGPSGGGFRLTPRAKLYPMGNSTRHAQDEDRLQLNLKTVIGTTTSSPNAFDSSLFQNVFVYCAGPAAIVSYVQKDLAIVQRVFRAKPNTLPINATSSFYNPATPPTTPIRSRYPTQLKDAAQINGISPHSGSLPDVQGNTKVQNRVREATPRVLLFSTSAESPGDVPLSILTDHSFGVQSVALSGDCKWLCTLGNSYDAFLLLYSLNSKTGAAKLHSSNKCSNVHSIIWMEDSIVSFGTRHVKVWAIEKPSSPTKSRLVSEAPQMTIGSPGPKILTGRNCLLGSLIDAIFTAACAILGKRAVVGTSQGDVCLLKGTDQKLETLVQVEYSIKSLQYDGSNNSIWVGGNAGQLQCLPLDLLESKEHQIVEQSLGSEPSAPGIIALGMVRDHLIIVDDNKVVELRQIEGDAAKIVAKRLPAHDSAVLGVCSLFQWQRRGQTDFLTFAARGTILFWNLDGTCTGGIDIPIDQSDGSFECEPNELKALTAAETEDVMFVGDKYGLLRVIDRSGAEIAREQAHNGDINEVATTGTDSRVLICTCGRDRTLQLFEWSEETLNLIQTIDDHAASVTAVQFVENGSTLISSSSDRSILLRRAAYSDKGSLAFLPVRTITLRASPVSLTIAPFDSQSLLVSTMDRQIQRFNLSSGRLLQTFKPSDPYNNDSVMTSSLQTVNVDSIDGALLAVLAVSSTDKSIRLHDYDSGALLAREHGQAAVSCARVLQKQAGDDQSNYLISCGMDGTVIIYRVTATSASQRYSTPSESPIRAESPLKQTPSSAPPMRKTLTKSEIAEFQRSFESSGDTISPMRSHSPSRLTKNSSRSSLAARTNAMGNSAANLGRNASKPSRRSSQDHSSTSTSPKNTVKTQKPRSRPSLDPRRRSKSAANLNDLNSSAEQLCESLRNFGKRCSSSIPGKIKPETIRELQGEMYHALQAVNDLDCGKSDEVLPSELLPAGQSFDAYIAKMIDERLAVKIDMKENRSIDSTSGTKRKSVEQAQSGASE